LRCENKQLAKSQDTCNFFSLSSRILETAHFLRFTTSLPLYVSLSRYLKKTTRLNLKLVLSAVPRPPPSTSSLPPKLSLLRHRQQSATTFAPHQTIRYTGTAQVNAVCVAHREWGELRIRHGGITAASFRCSFLLRCCSELVGSLLGCNSLS